MNRIIRIRNTEDAVATIAAYVTKTLAGIAPGHDLETVGQQMTTDRALTTIRTAYEHRTTAKGDTPKDAVTAVGVRLIHAYRAQHGL
ncbi:hypothetical protein RM572_00510 [Streptomyces sp. DSM 42041]|uniref:Uncharacterized protein n=1 Tax=Streptomyces hazeniae TaxID=3075538 RepID=A0ABU2NLA9_9ACTN|nr:hypothetical protein [Streptomyces sp. DSM 42041]MDT0377257.1 hypothetical protein [Streptomyces sp. DSM 42041]